MRKRKAVTATVAIVLAALLILAVFASVISAFATSQDELDELQEQADDLAAQQADLEQSIQAMQNEQTAIIARKQLLDERINLTQQEIDNLNAQIALLDTKIADKENEYAACQEEEARQYELFRERVRAMEENGSISYYSVIFDAASFSDLLSRLDDISEIMEYDEEVVVGLEQAKAATEQARIGLLETRETQETSKEQQETKQSELEQQVAEADALMVQLENNEEAYRQTYEENVELETQLQSDIAELEAKIAAEEAAAAAAAAAGQSNGESSGGGYSDVDSTGTYIWPSASSRYVTSPFGPRLHPILGYWVNHNGIDIGAGYGTSILAADSGVVVTATYSSSYGNYVMIYHGDNRYTLYAHMSSIAVSVDDNVTQGETIGYVGSTGYSTGPHVHFEIRINGSYADPLNYFSNYIKFWD